MKMRAKIIIQGFKDEFFGYAHALKKLQENEKFQLTQLRLKIGIFGVVYTAIIIHLIIELIKENKKITYIQMLVSFLAFSVNATFWILRKVFDAKKHAFNYLIASCTITASMPIKHSNTLENKKVSFLCI